MTLGDDIAAALPGLRAQAESMMRDTVKVTREGEPVWNEETGTYTPALVTVYEGKARFRLVSTAVTDVDAQSQLLAIQQPRLDVPVTVELATDDLVTVTASTFDSTLVGKTMRVAGVFVQSLATAHRYPVQIGS